MGSSSSSHFPQHIDERVIVTRVSPGQGRGWVPSGQCRPAGDWPSRLRSLHAARLPHLLQQELGDLAGLDAIVVGRSNIVGKPMAQLLLQRELHGYHRAFRTRDLPGAVRRSDIVVAAVGRPELIRGDWIKPGATVIDVGQERVEQPDGTRKLLGDVAFDEAVKSPVQSPPCPAASAR